MTTGMKAVTTICLVILFATPLARGVFAQEDDLATTTATTSESVESEIVVAEEPWYKSERIFGNIEVGDFVVGPGRTEIELSPGESIIQEVTVTNRISDGRTFRIEVEDITGSSDGSSAVSLTGETRGPYSIRDYISFPKETFELKLGERARIPITVSVPPDAEPGGYYGSVLVSTVQKGSSGEGTVSRSPVIARVGSLFFLTVRGDALTEGKTLEIATVSNKWWYESGPIDMGILYENTGSVHVNPYGGVSITNMFGEEVGFVELEPWFVLPKSLRVREITWDREFLLGRYTVTAQINRGYDDLVDEVKVSFWVLPWKIVGGMFVVLFLIIFSMRAFFRTFEFKRKGE